MEKIPTSLSQSSRSVNNDGESFEYDVRADARFLKDIEKRVKSYRRGHPLVDWFNLVAYLASGLPSFMPSFKAYSFGYPSSPLSWNILFFWLMGLLSSIPWPNLSLTCRNVSATFPLRNPRRLLLVGVRKISSFPLGPKKNLLLVFLFCGYFLFLDLLDLCPFGLFSLPLFRFSFIFLIPQVSFMAVWRGKTSFRHSYLFVLALLRRFNPTFYFPLHHLIFRI